MRQSRRNDFCQINRLPHGGLIGWFPRLSQRQSAEFAVVRQILLTRDREGESPWEISTSPAF